MDFDYYCQKDIRSISNKNFYCNLKESNFSFSWHLQNDKKKINNAAKRRSRRKIDSNLPYAHEVIKVQWQIWDILEGVSSLGVSFTRRILAWHDK